MTQDEVDVLKMPAIDRNVQNENYTAVKNQLTNIAKKFCNEFCDRYHIADKLKALNHCNVYSFASHFDKFTLEPKVERSIRSHKKVENEVSDSNPTKKQKTLYECFAVVQQQAVVQEEKEDEEDEEDEEPWFESVLS